MTTPAATLQPIDLAPRMRAWGLPLKAQGARGTCSVFALTAAIEYALARRSAGATLLSEEFLNWATHAASGEPGDGGFFDQIWAGFEAHGCCLRSSEPYRDAYDPGYEPSEAARAEARKLVGRPFRLHWIKPWDVETGLTPGHHEAVEAALRAGWPVCAGMRWPREAAWIDGALRVAPDVEVYDGHSVLVTGITADPLDPAGALWWLKDSAAGGLYRAIPARYAGLYVNDLAWVELP